MLFPRYPLFADDLAFELERSAIDATWVEAASLSVERFDELLSAGGFDAVVSINFSPELAWLATRRAIPYLSWTVDPLPPSRLGLHPGTDPSRCLVFAHSEHVVASLLAAGVASATWLPLAAPSNRRVPPSESSPLGPPSFVGITLERDHDRYVERLLAMGARDEVVEAWEQWVDDLARNGVDDVRFAAPSGVAFELPDELLAASPPSLDRADWADAILGSLSFRLRTGRIEALARHDVDVYGDGAWTRFTRRYRGPAHHGAELTRIYGQSAISLDLPRVYQRDIVTMRVFDVLACGGLVVTEPSRDLARCFVDGEHLRTYSDTRSLDALMTELSASPEEARRLREAGREHVLSHHTIELRARVLLDALRTRGWNE